MKIRILGKCLAVGLSAFLAISSATADVLEGVNDVHIGWMKPDERAAEIKAMAQAGVASVRVDLRPPFDKVIDAVAELYQAHISVDLVIDIADAALDGKDAPLRPGRGTIYTVVPLSSLDVSYFRTHFDDLLGAIDSRGIRLAALELGNEINWAPFNGDLAVLPMNGKPGTNASKVSGLEDGPKYLDGLRRYVEALGVVRAARDASVINRDAKVISAGLALVPVSFAANFGAEYVDPNETLQALIALGMDKIVDGYGVHFYPDPASPPTQIASELDELVQSCGKGAQKHPCWITEWGVAQTQNSCPSDESKRLPTVTEIKSLINGRARQGQVGAWYYYDWSGAAGQSYGIWRCSKLTESGHVLFDRK